VTLPRLKDVEVGDVLELDRVHEVGSRDYTLRAQDSMNTRTRGVPAMMRRSVNTHQERLHDLLRQASVSDQAESSFEAVLNEDGSVKESQSWAARLKPSGLAHVGAVLDKDTVRVRCTVVEQTKGRMEFIVKKKRRKGYKKTIKHKQTYTRLRVEGIQLGE
jgi:large subunit ribosomal protein L21